MVMLEEYFSDNDWYWEVGLCFDEYGNTRKIYTRNIFDSKPVRITCLGVNNGLIDVNILCLKNGIKSTMQFKTLEDFNSFVQIFD